MSITLESPAVGNLGEAFFAAFNDHDIDRVGAQLNTAATVDVEAAELSSAGPDELLALLAGVITAFPDAEFLVLRTGVLSDGSCFVEGSLKGNQAAPFMGAPNQGAHLVIRQVWRFGVADGQVTSVAGYWCQNTVYRRLGVQRIDELSR